jgi:hypothetical protein
VSTVSKTANESGVAVDVFSFKFNHREMTPVADGTADTPAVNTVSSETFHIYDTANELRAQCVYEP